MECREAMELLSPYLDGELSAAETEALETHLKMCVTCREEMETLRLISGALQAGADTVQAPPGFAGGVVAALGRRRLPWYTRLPGVWKQAVAAAAALALIAAGSLHMGLGQLFTRVGPQVAENPSGPKVVVPGPGAQSDPGVKEPGQSEPAGPNDVKPNDDEPGTPPAGGSPPDETGTPSDNVPPPSVSDQVAFLSNLDQPRVIQSTMLGVRVDSLNQAREQVAAATSQANGKMETLSVYNTAEGRQETVKVTVAADAAPAVIEKIGALGEVVARENTSRDITGEFRSQAEQYLVLASQVKNTTNEAERQELEQSLSGLERQLRAWLAETGQYTIVVQLRVE